MGTSERRCRRGGRVAWVVVASGCVSVLGCDEDSSPSGAIKTAAVELSVLNPDGTPTVSREHAERLYRKVIGDLRDATTRGTEAEKSAALLLTARAQAGLAEGTIADAVRSKFALASRVTAGRRDLSAWLSLTSRAAALDAHDPSAELASIDADVRARQGAVASAQQQKAELEARVASLRAQVTSKLGEAQSLRAKSAELRREVRSVSAVEGEPILARAVELKRQADALEADAARVEAEANRVAPGGVEIDLDVARLRDEIARLGAARKATEDRAAGSKQRAAEARARAAEVATALRSTLGEIEAAWTAEGTGYSVLTDAAIAALDAAGATARRAGGDHGLLAAGSASSAIAELRRQRAAELTYHADLLDAVRAASVPGLDVAARARELREAAAEELKSAAQADQAAFDALGRVRGVQGADQALARVGEALAGRAYRDSRGEVDFREAARTATASAAPASGGEFVDFGGGVSADDSTPEGLIALVYERLASGDAGSLLEYIHTDVPALQNALPRLVGLQSVSLRLDAAFRERFGMGMDEAAAQGAGAGMAGALGAGGMGFDGFNPDEWTASDYSVEREGDRAIASTPDGNEVKMISVGGVWRVDLTREALGPEADAMVPMLAMMMPMLGQFEQLMAQMERDLRAGTFATPDAFFAELARRGSGLMGGQMPGMGGPGGG